jgi:dTDP-4-dehydrorhamnose 3,5-epimerase
MQIEDLPLKDAKVFRLQRLNDNRGWFTEYLRQSWLDDAGITNRFIFDYVSFSINQGTLRGMHAQSDQAPQAKLVTTLNGSILDILVDARIDSPTFGKTCTVQIDRDNPCIVYVPRGFYHGFITLTDNTYVSYKVDNYYNAQEERGFTYTDSVLSDIIHHFNISEVSDRDKAHPSWIECYKFKGTV